MSFLFKHIVFAMSMFIFDVFVANASAEHSLKVQKEFLRGRYLEALTSYEKLPKRKTTLQSRLAAVESAWALGLHKRAIRLIEELKLKSRPTDQEWQRAAFIKAILHFQDGDYETCISTTQRFLTVKNLPSEIRGEAELLLGTALYKQGEHVSAARVLLSALDNVKRDSLGEVHYLLGQIRFGELDMEMAQQHFSSVSQSSPNAARAIRYLAEISFKQSECTRAQMWIQEGLELFEEFSLDSWSTYVMVKCGLINAEKGTIPEVLKTLEEAKNKFPKSDVWINLAEAEAESFFVTKQLYQQLEVE